MDCVVSFGSIQSHDRIMMMHGQLFSKECILVGRDVNTLTGIVSRCNGLLGESTVTHSQKQRRRPSDPRGRFTMCQQQPPSSLHALKIYNMTGEVFAWLTDSPRSNYSILLYDEPHDERAIIQHLYITPHRLPATSGAFPTMVSICGRIEILRSQSQ